MATTQCQRRPKKFLPTVLLGTLLLAGDLARAELPAKPTFEADVRPILERLCFDCHANGAAEGNVRFDAYATSDEFFADRPLWGKVWNNVLTETMPPADMPQPSDDERRSLSRWIAQTPFGMDDPLAAPGRVTIRRLNRDEYHYVVKDLLGIDFNVEEHFPADDTGYGFDTIGDVLTIPPRLLDKYFSAAETIVDRILDEAKKPKEAHSNVYRNVFFEGPPPKDRKAQLGYARAILARLAERAYRRPINDASLDKLLWLTTNAMDNGATFEQSVGRALTAMLVSPRFLYRAEYQPRPNDPRSVYPLDEHALASRLSFFLWSSIPDQQLLELAEVGKLREQLPSELRRMLADGKSKRFLRRFVGQWLQIDKVIGVHKADKLHNTIAGVRPLMRRETEMLFAHVLDEDRSAIELLTADYTFLNERLAEFYGIDEVRGNKMRRVALPADTKRGGLLTHASVLLVTSNADRTSPVKRGRFILDNILGIPPPPAPPDVPPLRRNARGNRILPTMRQQLAQHRADPECATCHDRMDSLGLALEHFDAIGRWRDDEHGQPIDATGQLVSGQEFHGAEELREILAEKPRMFYRCLARKMMTYALGRGIEYTDIPAIEAIVDRMLENDGRMSSLLLGIVESPQFQLRRGEGRNEQPLRGEH